MTEPKRIAQKWGFGMAPIKPAIQATRIEQARRVLHLIASDEDAIGKELCEEISVTKGLFNRTWRQDQWDWFTVWMQFGRPGRNQANSIGIRLAELRKEALSGTNEGVWAVKADLRNLGAPHFLKQFVNPKSRLPSLPEGYGQIYVLGTREQREILKIGFTTRNVEDRVKEINSATGIVIPYGVRGVWIVKNPKAVESAIHQRLSDFRVRADREFFAIEFREAFSIIRDVIYESKAIEV